MGSCHSGSANLVRGVTHSRTPIKNTSGLCKLAAVCAISGQLEGKSRVGGKISIPFWSLQLISEERTGSRKKRDFLGQKQQFLEMDR